MEYLVAKQLRFSAPFILQGEKKSVLAGQGAGSHGVSAIQGGGMGKVQIIVDRTAPAGRAQDFFFFVSYRDFVENEGARKRLQSLEMPELEYQVGYDSQAFPGIFFPSERAGRKKKKKNSRTIDLFNCHPLYLVCSIIPFTVNPRL